MTASEADLLRLAQAGDARAFATLAERHRSRVQAVAWRLTRDSSVAREITQTAFVRLQSALATLRHDSSLGTWLYRVVVNLCHDHAREHARERSTLSLDEVTNMASTDVRPDAEVEAAERARIIDSVLQALPGSLRETVVLRYVGGLAYDEIAAAQGCAPGTVASRIHRALRAIGLLLEAQGFKEGSL